MFFCIIHWTTRYVVRQEVVRKMRWQRGGKEVAERWQEVVKRWQGGGRMEAKLWQWMQDGGKMEAIEARWRHDGGKMEEKWRQD